MRKIIWIAILLIGCETKEHANAELDALAKAQKAAAKASAHANTGESEEIGVLECDQYIRNYENCLMQKVPPTRQANLRAALEDARAAADAEAPDMSIRVRGQQAVARL